MTYVLPAELLMSVGLAGVFIPASSIALIGVGSHDAGVASAVLNSSQQIGGSLGTALLNTVFAAAVTAYLAANAHTPQEIGQLTPYRADPRLPRRVRLGCRSARGRTPLRGRPDQREEGGRADRGRRAGRLVEAHPLTNCVAPGSRRRIRRPPRPLVWG